MHGGQGETAKRMAQNVVDSFGAGDEPIVVNSAGCGAMMKEYGELLGTAQGAEFSSRVRDLAEALRSTHSKPVYEPLNEVVTYQAACHLKQVQGVDSDVVDLLRSVPELSVVRTEDEDRCCGAGGMYSILQPEMANELRAKKLDAIARSGGALVVTSNPGCIAHLSSDKLEIRHVASVLATALATESRRPGWWRSVGGRVPGWRRHVRAAPIEQWEEASVNSRDSQSKRLR